MCVDSIGLYPCHSCGIFYFIKTMNNIITIAKFYRKFRKRRPILYTFLKEHKALKKFAINCKFNNRDCNTIGGAFIWSTTKEGQRYWEQLSTEYDLYEKELLNEL